MLSGCSGVCSLAASHIWVFGGGCTVAAGVDGVPLLLLAQLPDVLMPSRHHLIHLQPHSQPHSNIIMLLA